MEKIFILLPAYNEASSLSELLDRIKYAMQSGGYEYEIILYNDGSTDRTPDILKDKKQLMPLHIIGKTQNEGLGYAMRSLLDEVLSLSKNPNDIAIAFDADNTHNPEHMHGMIMKVRNGFDLVIASRYLPDSRIVGLTLFRKWISAGAGIMMRILFPLEGVRDYTCGYRAYKLELLRRLKARFGDKLVEETGFACMAEILIKIRTLKPLASEVPLILRYDQKGGASKMNIVRTIKRTLAMLVRLLRIR